MVDKNNLIYNYIKNNPDNNKILISLLEYIFTKPISKNTYIYLAKNSQEKLSSFKEFVDLLPEQDDNYKRFIYQHYTNILKQFIFYTLLPIFLVAIYLKN